MSESLVHTTHPEHTDPDHIGRPVGENGTHRPAGASSRDRVRFSLIGAQLLVTALALFVTISALAFWRMQPTPNHLDRAAGEALAVALGTWGSVVATGLTLIREMVDASCVFLLGCFVATTRSRRPRIAAAIALIVLANLSTQSFKWLFAQVMPAAVAAIPSGHTTAGLSVAAAVTLLLVERRPTPVVAAAAFYAAFAPLAVVSGNWHRPLDAVAAAVVVLTWTAALAWMSGLDLRLVCRMAARAAVPACVGASCLAVVAVALGSRPGTQSSVHLVVGLAEHLLLPGLGAVCVAFASGVARASVEQNALR